FTVPVAGNQPMPIVDPELIVVLIDHCQRQERLRFIYRGEDPADPDRLDAGRQDSAEAEESTSDVHLEVEPYRLVNRQHRWYLLTFDPAFATGGSSAPNTS